jgi:hypothetical protein
MCFYSDPDWYASQVEEDEGPALSDCRCCECRRVIKAGEWRKRVEMQEREDGIYCTPDKGEHADGCDGEDCEYDGPGETWAGHFCRDCETLRAAIRKVEEAEGCHGSEAEPSMGGIYDEVGNGQGWMHYFDEFVRLDLWDAVALVPAFDWDDLMEHLAYEGHGYNRYRGPSGPYAGAVCELTDGEPVERFDLGGEA